MLCSTLYIELCFTRANRDRDFTSFIYIFSYSIKQQASIAKNVLSTTIVQKERVNWLLTFVKVCTQMFLSSFPFNSHRGLCTRLMIFQSIAFNFTSALQISEGRKQNRLEKQWCTYLTSKGMGDNFVLVNLINVGGIFKQENCMVFKKKITMAFYSQLTAI